jgi:zinc transport system substrate-binding protein
MKTFFKAAALFFVFLAPAAGAGSRPVVVASVVPIYNIISAIGGDRIELILLVPTGASPHTYSPKPSSVKSVARAKLMVMAGAGMEFWADKIIESSGNKNLQILYMTDGVKLIASAEEGEGHHESGNPHVWLDAGIVKIFAARITEALSALSPADRGYFYANLKKFDTETGAADAKIKKEAKTFKVKEFVAFHPSWVYFAKRYGLSEVGEIQKSPGKDPTPKDLEAIINEIKQFGMKAVFAEPQLPKKAAEVIAAEAGVKLMILDPYGTQGENYSLFLLRNFEIMKSAMK